MSVSHWLWAWKAQLPHQGSDPQKQSWCLLRTRQRWGCQLSSLAGRSSCGRSGLQPCHQCFILPSLMASQVHQICALYFLLCVTREKLFLSWGTSRCCASQWLTRGWRPCDTGMGSLAGALSPSCPPCSCSPPPTHPYIYTCSPGGAGSPPAWASGLASSG